MSRLTVRALLLSVAAHSLRVRIQGLVLYRTDAQARAVLAVIIWYTCVPQLGRVLILLGYRPRAIETKPTPANDHRLMTTCILRCSRILPLQAPATETPRSYLLSSLRPSAVSFSVHRFRFRIAFTSSARRACPTPVDLVTSWPPTVPSTTTPAAERPAAAATERVRDGDSGMRPEVRRRVWWWGNDSARKGGRARVW
ncbi:hypothetical protein C8J57DRAFT_1472420 [Mycena rebaudengoi]|nr:hypothetical protein C8J57DRAFT_1472420 [Mycena rebaudengoi]